MIRHNFGVMAVLFFKIQIQVYPDKNLQILEGVDQCERLLQVTGMITCREDTISEVPRETPREKGFSSFSNRP